VRRRIDALVLGLLADGEWHNAYELMNGLGFWRGSGFFAAVDRLESTRRIESRWGWENPSSDFPRWRHMYRISHAA
jgi:hypothetical protein